MIRMDLVKLNYFFQLGLFARRMRAKDRQRRERRGRCRCPFVPETRSGASWESDSRLLSYRYRFCRGPSLLAGLYAESRPVGSSGSLRFCIRRHVCQRLDEHDDEHEHALRVRISLFFFLPSLFFSLIKTGITLTNQLKKVCLLYPVQHAYPKDIF